MSRANHASDRAAAFIIAQEDGGWTDADQAEFDAWLAEADGNKAAYWRMKHSWREAERIGALGRGAGETDDHAIRPESRRRWVPAAMAASITAMVSAGYMVWQPAQQTTNVAAIAYNTPMGGRKVVDLADGSRVQLNTSSVVRTSVTNDQREVWLDKGEAFFEVKHDGRPFVVHAGNRQITVLGTKFSVRRDGDKVTVSVLEGRVRVDEIDGRHDVRSATISRGDIALDSESIRIARTRSVEGNLSIQRGGTWRGWS